MKKNVKKACYYFVLYVIAIDVCQGLTLASSSKDSSGIHEVLSNNPPVKTTTTNSSNTSKHEKFLKSVDPYNEFAEPNIYLIPESANKRRLNHVKKRVVKRVANVIARHKRINTLLNMKPLPPHKRSKELDSADPYTEIANQAYYEFVRQIIRERNTLFRKTSDASLGLGELIDGYTTRHPPSETTETPSPEVKKCPMFEHLTAAYKCDPSSRKCSKDKECLETERCCFDGCNLACTDNLIRHVCTDFNNETFYQNDVYMFKKDLLCTCDGFGRPIRCRKKKPCVDVISYKLFQLGLIDDKNSKPKTQLKTRRQKIYSALNSAFGKVNKY